MMAGYWQRPDLTAASIVELPSESGGSDRWYRTGDLVVERPDGNLEFLGRVDNQIKLRGYRIELEAIDAALADIEGLHAGTVVVLEWFNPGCPFVVKAHGEGPLADMASKQDAEVVWLAINSGAPGKQGHGVEANRAAAEQWARRRHSYVAARPGV